MIVAKKVNRIVLERLLQTVMNHHLESRYKCLMNIIQLLLTIILMKHKNMNGFLISSMKKLKQKLPNIPPSHP